MRQLLRRSLLLPAFLVLLALPAIQPALAVPIPDDPARAVSTAIHEGAPYAVQPTALKAAVLMAVNEDDKLTATDGAAGDGFGFSVAVSGNWAIVGSWAADANGSNSGAAYVFAYDGISWSETAKLLPSDGAAGERFGYAVSVSGDRVLIGARDDDANGTSSGSAYVFDYDGSAWSQTAKLLPTNGNTGDRFGYSVSLSGNRALIGALDDDDNGTDSGTAYIFDYNGTAWSQTISIQPSDNAAGDRFGHVVSLSGDRALIGAYRNDDDGTDSGSAYIFDYNGSSWSQSFILTASDAAASENFGYSVSLEGDRALIGARQDDDNGTNAGSAYVFDYNGSAWGQSAKLLASDGAANELFGFSVALSGDRALVGAYGADSGANTGAAYVYEYDAGTLAWNEADILLASDGAAGDRFGYAVSLSGDQAFSGAYEQAGIGATYVYDLVPATIAANAGAPVAWPLDVVILNIDVTGTNNLLGVAADLAYEAAALAFNDGSLAAGPYLYDGTMLLFENDDDAGTLSWSVTRSGSTGASGDGTAATMTFTLPDYATPADISYTLSDVAAVDPDGNPLPFTIAAGSSFTVGGVWPGDADNNCTVDASDLLVIGLRFGNTGPARLTLDRTWVPQAFSPWGGSSAALEFADSFIDTDGDGEIDEGDVLAIGVNFGETHAESTGCDDGVPKGRTAHHLALASRPIGSVIELALTLDAARDDLLGTAFHLAVDPSVYALEGVTPGVALGDDLLEIVRLDPMAGTGQAAFTRKGEAAPGAGQTLAVVRLRVLAAEPSEVSFTDVKLSSLGGVATAPGGLRLQADAVDAPVADLPQAFALHGAYPNPFNPETTVSFDLPAQAQVRLVVFDVLGRQVQAIDAGTMAAGASRSVRFTAGSLPSGLYLYRLEVTMAGERRLDTGRFTLLK